VPRSLPKQRPHQRVRGPSRRRWLRHPRTATRCPRATSGLGETYSNGSATLVTIRHQRLGIDHVAHPLLADERFIEVSIHQEALPLLKRRPGVEVAVGGRLEAWSRPAFHDAGRGRVVGSDEKLDDRTRGRIMPPAPAAPYDKPCLHARSSARSGCATWSMPSRW
jgi:hypothetical protein